MKRIIALAECLLVTGLLVGCTALPAKPGTSAATLPLNAPVVDALTLQGPPVPPKPKTADMAGLKKKLETYLSKQDGTYGAYVIDLDSGRGFGINADTVFPTASTFKLPMTMYILDRAEEGKVNLDEQIAYTAADYEEGTGVLQDSISEGDSYPVRKLVELAITESDNIATNMLLRRFGLQNVYDYMHKLGGKVTHFDDQTIGSTPREMAYYMRQLNGKTISDPKLKQFLINSLEHTAFHDRSEAGVPDGVKVAHKIGTLPGVVNDVAMVYAPKHTFIVAVMSMDVEDEVAPGVIEEITREVYDTLSES